MKFFTYGMLKSDQPKAWMIPFAKSKPHVLDGFVMYRRSDGKAAMKRGGKNDYVKGEVREVTWTDGIFIGRLLKRMLLYFLDLNEGVQWDVYERIELMAFYTYLFKGNVDNYEVIHEWHGKEAL